MPRVGHIRGRFNTTARDEADLQLFGGVAEIPRAPVCRNAHSPSNMPMPPPFFSFTTAASTDAALPTEFATGIVPGG